jgi:hypothetical protein
MPNNPVAPDRSGAIGRDSTSQRQVNGNVSPLRYCRETGAPMRDVIKECDREFEISLINFLVILKESIGIENCNEVRNDLPSVSSNQRSIIWFLVGTHVDQSEVFRDLYALSDEFEDWAAFRDRRSTCLDHVVWNLSELRNWTDGALLSSILVADFVYGTTREMVQSVCNFYSDWICNWALDCGKKATTR